MPKRKRLRLSLLQISPDSDFNKVLRKTVSLAGRNLERREADIVCLPEAWMHPNPYSVVEKLCQKYSMIIAAFSKVAREYSTAIALGGLYEETNSKRFITCPVVGPNEEIVARQRKVHLFRREKRLFNQGRSFQSFVANGTRVGINVCHDIVYPEAARVLALEGAEVLLNPSRIVTPGIEPWHIYLMSRCLENRVFVAASNIYYPPYFNGRSVVLQPLEDKFGIVYPVKASQGGEKQEAINTQLELGPIEKSRAERLANRVPKVYARIANARGLS